MSHVDNLHIESEDRDADVLITKDITFDAAKQQEIVNWQNNNVFQEVKDKGQKCYLYKMGLYAPRNCQWYCPQSPTCGKRF